MKERGGVLAAAVMLLAMMMVLAVSLVRIVHHRHMLAARTEDSLRSGYLVQAAAHMAQACLESAPAGCRNPSASCMPRSIDGRRVTVRVTGTAPSCLMSVTVDD